MNQYDIAGGIGRYRRIREVGSGSFGRAVLVANTEEKQFVMKVIDISRMSYDEKKKALQEASLLSKLKHPFIVTYHESWCDKNNLYIVMDYAERGDLQKYIYTQKKMNCIIPEKKIIRWLTQVTLALKYMHQNNILHRDVKSSNLFLLADGRVRLGDFGIAKELKDKNSFASTSIGTPYYISPEICSESPYSFASDVWSLGVVMYELCALQVPFDGMSLKNLMHKITNENCKELPSHYSFDLKNLIYNMLKKKPSQRPSIDEILRSNIIQNEIKVMLDIEREKKRNDSMKKIEREHKKVNIQSSEKKTEKNLIYLPAGKPSISSRVERYVCVPPSSNFYANNGGLMQRAFRH